MAISYAGVTDATLKDNYSDSRLQFLLHGKSHRLVMNTIDKKQGGGRSMPTPVYSDRGGIQGTADYTAAVAAAAEPQVDSFDPLSAISQSHRVVDLDTEMLGRAKGSIDSANAFLGNVFYRTDQAIEGLADERERQAFDDGWGVIGQVNNTVFTGNQIDLVLDANAKNFHKHQQIVFAPATTKHEALRDSGDFLTVDGVDTLGTTNQVTCTTNLNSIAGIAQNDYVFARGNAANNTTVRPALYGFAAWAETPVASENFLGVDRSKNPAALAMLQTAGDASNIQKSVIETSARIWDANGGVITRAVMNAIDFSNFVDQLGGPGKVERREGTKALAGYAFIQVVGVTGTMIEVVLSPYVVQNTIWCLAWPTWKWKYLHQRPVRINDDDGRMTQSIASGTTTGQRVNADSWVQQHCVAPGHNAKMTLS